MSLSISQEALLMTLAAMTQADTSVLQVEVEAVQRLMKETLGVDVSSQEVHVASKSEFIENRKIDDYIKSIAKDLSTADKKLIVRSLKFVIQSDGNVNNAEIDMFNRIVGVLGLTPAELVQL